MTPQQHLANRAELAHHRLQHEDNKPLSTRNVDQVAYLRRESERLDAELVAMKETA